MPASKVDKLALDKAMRKAGQMAETHNRLTHPPHTTQQAARIVNGIGSNEWLKRIEEIDAIIGDQNWDIQPVIRTHMAWLYLQLVYAVEIIDEYEELRQASPK